MLLFFQRKIKSEMKLSEMKMAKLLQTITNYAKLAVLIFANIIFDLQIPNLYEDV